jgi:hypothetical protein
MVMSVVPVVMSVVTMMVSGGTMMVPVTGHGWHRHTQKK